VLKEAVSPTGRGAHRVVRRRGSHIFIDNRPTDGSEVVSLTCRPPFTLRKIPDTHFCWRQSQPQGYSAAGRIRPVEKPNDVIGNGTRDLPASSKVPQPNTLPRPAKQNKQTNSMV
jgi:hypothetical protein